MLCNIITQLFPFYGFKGNTISQSVLTLPLVSADWAKSKDLVILSTDEEMRLCRHHSFVNKSGIRNNIIIRLMLDLGLLCAEVSYSRYSFE